MLDCKSRRFAFRAYRFRPLQITSIAAAVVSLSLAPLARAQTVDTSALQSFQTSISLPPGSSIYLYGMDTGGGVPSTGFADGSYQAITDTSGYISAALASTTSSSDNYTFSSETSEIGAVAVSGYTSMTESYASYVDQGPSLISSGSLSVSDSFTVPAGSSNNPLVVIIGLASSQQGVAISGIPGLQVDQISSGSSDTPNAIIFAHAYLAPGTYTAVEESSVLHPLQDPNHMVDLIGVFVFSNGTSVSVGPDSLTLFIKNMSGVNGSTDYIATGEQDTSNLTNAISSALENPGVTLSTPLSPRVGVSTLPNSFHDELSEADLLIELPAQAAEWADDFLEAGVWATALDISGFVSISSVPDTTPLEIAGDEIEGTLMAVDKQEQSLFATQLCAGGQPYSIAGPQQQLQVTLTGLTIPKNATLDLSSLGQETLGYGTGGVFPQGCPGESDVDGYAVTPETISDLLNVQCQQVGNQNPVPCFVIEVLTTTRNGNSTKERKRKDVTIILP